MHQFWRQHTPLTWEHDKVSEFDNSWMLREDTEHLPLPMVSQGGVLKEYCFGWIFKKSWWKLVEGTGRFR